MRTLAAPVLVLLMAAPAFAKGPPSAYLERQQDAGEEAARPPDTPKSTCRVVKEWKVGETVVQHRICDDPPKPAARTGHTAAAPPSQR